MRRDVETISVIGSGWSLAGVDLARIPGLRIGVNDSAWRTRVDLGVTMDRLLFEGRLGQIRACFRDGGAGAFYYRAGIDKAGAAPAHWIPFDCDNESSSMSREWSPRCRLNGQNSGICGINLAYRLAIAGGVPRVILWGFDMCRSPKGAAYYHDPYPWAPAGATKAGKYSTWSAEFGSIARQFKAAGVELLNASPPSAITALAKIDPQKVLL